MPDAGCRMPDMFCLSVPVGVATASGIADHGVRPASARRPGRRRCATSCGGSLRREDDLQARAVAPSHERELADGALLAVRPLPPADVGAGCDLLLEASVLVRHQPLGALVLVELGRLEVGARGEPVLVGGAGDAEDRRPGSGPASPTPSDETLDEHPSSDADLEARGLPGLHVQRPVRIAVREDRQREPRARGAVVEGEESVVGPVDVCLDPLRAVDLRLRDAASAAVDDASAQGDARSSTTSPRSTTAPSRISNSRSTQAYPDGSA